MNKKLILATTSPHRKKAFQMLGIPFETEGSYVDEYSDDRPSKPIALVTYLAKLKCEAVAKGRNEICTVIGFDSVGWYNNKILEKPKDKEEMISRLREMSDGHYQFYTGIHIIDILSEQKQKSISRFVTTDVEMRKLSNQEINWYLDQDPKFMTYAQGFDSLGTYGSTFIKSIRGSYNNVLRGIPLEVIVEMIQELGFKIEKN